MAAARPISAAAVEADVLTLVDSLASLVRAARVPEDGARPPPPRPGDPPPPPALAPAVAERLAGAAASLADAAAELKRRSLLADAGAHCTTVRAARARCDGATDIVSAGLAALADEAAEMVQRLDAHLAASAVPPPPADPAAEDGDGLNNLVALLGGYFGGKEADRKEA